MVKLLASVLWQLPSSELNELPIKASIKSAENVNFLLSFFTMTVVEFIGAAWQWRNDCADIK